jgi:hypothetical protein
VVTYGLAHANNGQAITPEQLRAVLNGTGAIIPDGEEVRIALQHALHSTFTVMMLIAALIVPACLLVPQPHHGDAVPDKV